MEEGPMDVAEWLRRLELKQYEPAFRANEIDERTLPSLTREDLKDLGVGLVGHRRRLLDAITTLGSPLPAPPPLAARAGEGRVGRTVEAIPDEIGDFWSRFLQAGGGSMTAPLGCCVSRVAGPWPCTPPRPWDRRGSRSASLPGLAARKKRAAGVVHQIRALQLGRQGSDDVDAVDLHQLADNAFWVQRQ
jgi:hypothetical protein